MYLEEKEFILIEWGERYSREIMREIGDEFKYYLLKIDMNAATDNTQKLSRNYSLYRMDDR